MSDLFHQLQTLLQEDVQYAEQLMAVLENEKSYLTTRDLKALPEVAGEKQRLTSKIEENNAKKREIISPFVLSSSESSETTSSMLKHLSEEEAQIIRTLNQTIEAKLDDCKKLNALNGEVIIQSQKNQQELMGIITGGQNLQTYNATGKVVADQGPNQPCRSKV